MFIPSDLLSCLWMYSTLCWQIHFTFTIYVLWLEFIKHLTRPFELMFPCQGLFGPWKLGCSGSVVEARTVDNPDFGGLTYPDPRRGITCSALRPSYWSFERKTYTWWSPKSSHSWNPADFTWNLPDFMRISWNLADFTWNLPDFVHISWNLVDFMWHPVDFTWNLVDFTKSGGFHVKSSRFHMKSTYKSYKSNISRKTLQFYGVLWEGYVMFSHEIRRISKDQLPGMVSPMFSFLFRES